MATLGLADEGGSPVVCDGVGHYALLPTGWFRRIRHCGPDCPLFKDPALAAEARRRLNERAAGRSE